MTHRTATSTESDRTRVTLPGMSHNIHWANIFTSIGTVGAVAVSLGFGVGTYRSNHRRIKRSQLNQARTVVVSVEPPPTRTINSDGSLRVHNTGNFAIYDLHVTCLVEDHEWWPLQSRLTWGQAFCTHLEAHSQTDRFVWRLEAIDRRTGSTVPLPVLADSSWTLILTWTDREGLTWQKYGDQQPRMIPASQAWLDRQIEKLNAVAQKRE